MNNHKEELKKDFKEKTIGYITAAFGLVAGLAWNDAVKAVIDKLYPMGSEGIIAKFIYAVAVTILLILATKYIIGMLNKDDESQRS